MAKPSVDDLLGDASEEPKEKFSFDNKVIHAGVTTSWLMEAFRMDRVTVRKRLKGLPPIRNERGNVPIYDFKQAADLLATPKISVAEILKTLKPEDLPPGLQKDFWDALVKKQKYELQAKLLWRTEDVLDVFGDVFKHIKTSLQLFVSEVETKRGLTKEQRQLVIELVDALQTDIHDRLVEMPKKASTPSLIAHMPDEDNAV